MKEREKERKVGGGVVTPPHPPAESHVELLRSGGNGGKGANGVAGSIGK